MILRFIIAAVMLALVGGGLIWFNMFRDQMITDIFANLPEQVMPVTTVTVEPVTWRPGIEATGTVKASQGIDLTVETAGIVTQIAFAANDRVEQDQLLLQLDDVMQTADLAASRSQLDLAQTTLRRSRQLQQRGVAADANLETSQANARAAEAQVARAEAVVQQRRLVAPFDGIIGLPQVDPGAYISPGTVVATLQDIDNVHVDFSLPEQELPNLRMGQRIEARIAEDAQPLAGEITGIDPRIDSASRMVSIRAQIDGADGALTPGQFVRVSVVLPAEDGVIALPQTAVMSSLYGDYVYVLRDREDPPEGGATQEVAQVFVQPGRRSGGMIEVRGGAVTAGQQVVTSGQNRLSNGAGVRVDNTVTPDGQGQTPPAPSAQTAAAPAEPASDQPAGDAAP
ncbi:MAG: efflux RND transporter periplasmic adaptor subunit [Paracoccus sp. (in: a-proteobacteria)]|uniref:efflux RND transporter periplasmic adaptor subunit n=1 Tax=Paracoccus sp. TaxID=267 RepID=UPI0026DFDA4F|nr:efflux RND transporter periplasmic adaptor subunit [Paracoccus sp. (in: a-proteobacteria)]MDO5619948.1 efflux RND transporter periplasmic adaptor subunit [Paracoccus sp. (in: a-proteobacteria)]